MTARRGRRRRHKRHKARRALRLYEEHLQRITEAWRKTDRLVDMLYRLIEQQQQVMQEATP